MFLEKTKLMDINDLSKLIGLSPSYIYVLVKERKIPFYKPFGKKLYFNPDEVIQHMTLHKVEALNHDEISSQAADYMVKRGGENV